MEASNQEGRLLLAIQAYKEGQFKSIRAAAKSYNLPFTTLRDRLAGGTRRENCQIKNRKLTPIEEESLVQWVISWGKRGQPPQVMYVQDMANIILSTRLGDQASIGERWVQRFIKRHPNLKSKFTRKYDYQRALCEDPKVIRGWFELVKNTVAKYGITDQDIYNFDETGFRMGVAATARVITGSKRTGKPPTIQPGNTEWVTVVESVNAAGWSLPPMIIMKGKNHQASWYENLPSDWVIGLSENGWTSDKLGMIWLKQVFNKHTESRTIGSHRLLVLDGHGSHATPEFDKFCTDHSIIPLYMPPHSSHLLQPLDVSCFGPLKKAYGQQVEFNMRLGINHVDKGDFLTNYIAARAEAFKSNTIQNGFRATGLVPFNPEAVLPRLHSQLRTPTPPGTAYGSTSSWSPQTPGNIIQLGRQSEKIKQFLQCRSKSPPTPTHQALNQLVKGCQMAMHSAVILAKENSELRAANTKQKQKRGKKRSYIAEEGILTGAEGLARAQAPKEAPTPRTKVVEPAEPQSKKRAPARCSLCREFNHTARNCPQAEGINPSN